MTHNDSREHSAPDGPGEAVEPQTHRFYRGWVFDHWELVERLARRRFKDRELSGEAALEVLERLQREDWKLLREYRGEASLKTYFSVVVYRLLEDFSRRRFGRVRPPGWLRRLGGPWLLLYRLLCLERHSHGEATAMAADRYPGLGPERLERMADRILGEIPSCGAAQYVQEPLDDRQAAGVGAQPSGGKAVEARERELVLKALHEYFFQAGAGPRQHPALTGLADCPLELAADERLLLTLRHVEGLTVAEAGGKLGLNRFQAHGRLRRLYRRIREAFESAGCGEALRLLLEDDGDTK